MKTNRSKKNGKKTMGLTMKYNNELMSSMRYGAGRWYKSERTGREASGRGSKVLLSMQMQGVKRSGDAQSLANRKDDTNNVAYGTEDNRLHVVLGKTAVG